MGWLGAWQHVLQSEWAQAVTCAQGMPLAGWGSWQPWAFYRLGMYSTVADLPVPASDWRYVMPVTVSLAACGRYAQARSALQAVNWQRVPRKLRVALADALAPFMPVDALQLLQAFKRQGQVQAPATLHAGLLLRTGDVVQAQAVLQRALQAGQGRSAPELYLYQTMAQPDAPQQQLDRLNAFLQAYGVPAVALRDGALPPGPCNVQLAAPLPRVQGPLVSVLMTTYRTGARAAVAIESLLNQTYSNLEIIVVDDASGDATPDMVQAWADKDARVRLLRLPANVGTYVAKSMGLRMARGEFVTCHDSDDWSHPVKLERQVQPLLQDAALVATTSHWVRMQDDGVFYARPVHPLMRLNPSSPLFRRELVLQRMGAWDTVRTGADSEFHARLRLVFGRKAVRRVVQPLALGSHRVGSLMTAADTGYSETGISPHRLAYWESWSRWHLACLAEGKLPQLPLDLEALAQQRRFAAPPEMVLTAQQVRDAAAVVEAGGALCTGHAPQGRH